MLRKWWMLRAEVVVVSKDKENENGWWWHTRAAWYTKRVPGWPVLLLYKGTLSRKTKKSEKVWETAGENEALDSFGSCAHWCFE